MRIRAAMGMLALMAVGGCADSRAAEMDGSEAGAGGANGANATGGSSGAGGAGGSGGSSGTGAQSGGGGIGVAGCYPHCDPAGEGGFGGSDEDAGAPVPADCALPFDSGDCQAYVASYGFQDGRCRRFIYGDCGGNANRFQTIEACEATCEVECAVRATNDDLPGVTVEVEGDHCTLEGGVGGNFRYRIEIEEPIEYTRPASTGCGPCDDSLVTFDIGEGPVFYNERDVGCCPPVEEEEQALVAAPLTGTIAWPGVQWRGPSDTNQPYGPPFPAGEYKVRVRIDVPSRGAVVAELPITVVAGDPQWEGTACLGPEYAYPSGDTTFPDPTSCNTCLCDNGEVTTCTEIGCEQPCPDGTALGSDCGYCGPTLMVCGIRRTACLPSCATSDDCAGGDCVDGVCKVLCD